ncbi:glycoside hydrolase [Staphylotrichum tortipilum]|uniref:Glycoside hydrolase n=1 Tax=Staphylotrichum tortipilum TaxID=2831512 RepID=A0AAN6MKH5_9PEZI|nr:glycoside hydrolase [Staphylotrichum longicolle]
MAKSILSALALLMLATPALSVCTGMHTFGSCEDRIVHWYDPNTGEICDPLDCGGGRAPPKTNVPGCPGYMGTLTRATEASFMPCFTSAKPPPAPAAETTVSNPPPATLPPPAASPASTSSSTSAPPPPPKPSSDSAGGQVESTTSSSAAESTAGSSSASGSGLITTAPPTTLSSSTRSSTSTSSTTSEPVKGAGSRVVGGSWAVVAAGVVLGALAV